MVKVATWSKLEDRKPAYALVGDVDLVVVRHDDRVAVLYGRCLHRGALMADGSVRGNNLICGVHHWDYRYDTGVSEYNNEEALDKFTTRIDVGADALYVDEAEIEAWRVDIVLDLVRLLRRSGQSPEAQWILGQLADRTEGRDLRIVRGAQWRIEPSLKHSWYWIRAALARQRSSGSRIPARNH